MVGGWRIGALLGAGLVEKVGGVRHLDGREGRNFRQVDRRGFGRSHDEANVAAFMGMCREDLRVY